MIPAPPAGTVRFNAPPTWTVPAGFDPRRGHLLDPAWPTPPEGWSFWVTDPAAVVASGVPTTTLPRGRLEGGERRRLVITLGALVLVALLVVWAAVASGGDDEEATPGVGSCWTGGEWVDMVPCSSADAEYVVESTVSTPEQCPMSSPGYLEEGDAILCLQPLD